jgi:hypothetical protein
MRRFQTLVVFAGLFSLPLRCNAATIFSNLGPGESLMTAGIGIGFIPFTSTFNYAGIAFTPIGQSFTLDSVELPLQLSSGPNVADVFVTGDVGGLPSGILESFHLSGALPVGSAALVTLDSTSHPVLSAGGQYWVVAAGGQSSFVMWNQNELQEMGPNVSGPTLTSLVRDSDMNVREALLVSGTAVPEPGTQVLVGFFLLLYAGVVLGRWCFR